MNGLGHVVQARRAVGVQKRQGLVWAEAIRTGFTENRAQTPCSQVWIHCEEGGRRQGGPFVGNRNRQDSREAGALRTQDGEGMLGVEERWECGEAARL